MQHSSSSNQTERSRMSSSDLDRCAQNCLECYQVCAKTIAHCLSKGGKYAGPKHITLLEDCARICMTSGDLLIRRSDRHMITCEACAAICEECAEECREMGGDTVMEECADLCVRCAESCRAMSAH